jgi:hypothetical protein
VLLLPPQVSFKTTGGGSIRFNPNLYAEGKVCLSLLGTWSGGKGEGWNASASTALQVCCCPGPCGPGNLWGQSGQSQHFHAHTCMHNVLRWNLQNCAGDKPTTLARVCR